MKINDLLAQPIVINGLKIKNRLVKSATQENMADKEGIIKQSYCDYYDKLSAGGVGLIITGNMYVTLNGRNNFGMAGADLDKQIPHLRRVTNIVHKNGAIIFAQLSHNGLLATPESGIEKEIKAPSKIGRASTMSIEDIKNTVEAFARSAARMKKAGFDGVQIHGAHNWLVAQFLSKGINRRRDQYGGTLENRQRFCLEVYNTIRSEVECDYPVIIKLDSYSRFLFIPLIKLKEALNTAKKLEDAGIDAIEVSCGSHTIKGALPVKVAVKELLKSNVKSGKAVIAGAFFSALDPLLNRRTRFRPHHNLEHIKAFKQKLKIPILGVSCFRDPNYMRCVIENKEADMISLARPLIHNPNYPNEILNGFNHKSECLNCNLCIFLLPSCQPLQCYGGKAPLTSI